MVALKYYTHSAHESQRLIKNQTPQPKTKRVIVDGLAQIGREWSLETDKAVLLAKDWNEKDSNRLSYKYSRATKSSFSFDSNS